MKRQQRKLNFLITQTELYAHFMAKKLTGDSSETKTNAILERLNEGGPKSQKQLELSGCVVTDNNLDDYSEIFDLLFCKNSISNPKCPWLIEKRSEILNCLFLDASDMKDLALRNAKDAMFQLEKKVNFCLPVSICSTNSFCIM